MPGKMSLMTNTSTEPTALDRDVADAQYRYGAAHLTGSRYDWDEYEATVSLLSMNHGMDLSAAYDLVENGPVIIL
jgi:hypothetical protein